MTVWGFVKGGGHASISADGDTYEDGRPLPKGANKLCVSRSGFVATGTGYWSLLDRFLDQVYCLGAATFDDAAARLPATLRAASSAKREALGSQYGSAARFALIAADGEAVRGPCSKRRRLSPLRARRMEQPLRGRDAAAERRRSARVRAGPASPGPAQIPEATGKLLRIARFGAGKVAKDPVPLLLGDERDVHPPPRRRRCPRFRVPRHPQLSRRMPNRRRTRRRPYATPKCSVASDTGGPEKISARRRAGAPTIAGVLPHPRRRHGAACFATCEAGRAANSINIKKQSGNKRP